MAGSKKTPQTNSKGYRLHYRSGVYVSKSGIFFMDANNKYLHVFKDSGQKPYIKAKGNTYYVEDLVTDCYLPKPKGNTVYVLIHKDGKLDNCDVCNLEWRPAVYTFNTNTSTKIKINGKEITVKSDGKVYEGNNQLSQIDTLYDPDVDLERCISPYVGVNGKRVHMDDLVEQAHYVHGDKYSLKDPMILHKDHNRDNYASDNLEWVERTDQRYIDYRKDEVAYMRKRNIEENSHTDFPEFLQPKA